MMHRSIPDPLHESIARIAVRLSPPEQELAYATYQRLTMGAPSRVEVLAADTGMATRDVVRALVEGELRTLVLFDDTRSIVGFGGISLEPTRHRLTIDGRVLFTWCAWDALILPHVLGRAATLSTSCPATGDSIEVAIHPGIGVVDAPDGVTASFVLADETACRRSTEGRVEAFCEHVHFFVSADAARSWASARTDVTIVSLTDAERAAARFVAGRFPDVDIVRNRAVRLEGRVERDGSDMIRHE